MLNALRQKLQVLYESSLTVLDNIENSDTIVALKTLTHDKYEEIIRILRSQRLPVQFHELVKHAKSLMYKDRE